MAEVLNNVDVDKSYGIDEHTVFMLHGESITDYSGKGNVTFVDTDVKFENIGKFNKAFGFDGTPRKLEIQTPGITVGLGDFTLDFWIYMRDKTTHQDLFAPPVSDHKDLTVAYTNNLLRVTCGEQDEWCSSVPDFRHNWNHIAVVRESGALRTFVNGKKVLEATSTRNIKISSLIMGYHQSNVGYAADADIDEVRFSNVARWSEEFEPPKMPYSDGPLAPNFGVDANVKLLLTGESFADSSFSPIAIENDGAVLVPGRFNTAYDLASSKLFVLEETLQTKLDMPGEFTLDMWIMPKSLTGVQVIVDGRSKTKNGLYVSLVNGCLNTARNIDDWEIQSTYKLRVNEWTHVAYVRTPNNNVRLFANGILVGESKRTGTVENQGITIGRNQTLETEQFTGLIDEIRISNVARWSRNFVPPQTPYIRDMDFNIYNSGVDFIVFGVNGDISRVNLMSVYVNGVKDGDVTTNFNKVKYEYVTTPPHDAVIKIMCVFDSQNYGISKEIPYAKMTPLDPTAGITDAIARQESQMTLIELSKSRLYTILESKGQTVNTTMRLSELVELVENLNA